MEARGGLFHGRILLSDKSSKEGSLWKEQIVESPRPFGEVLDAVEGLSPDEQEALVAIMHRRLAERGRKTLAAEVEEARKEFAEGRCGRATPDEIAREILS